MRHADSRHQLNRFTSWHKATLKSLVKNLVIYQSVRTTLARAKAARPQAEKLISLSKKNTLSAKREAFRILGSHKLVSLLFKDLGPLFEKRGSGFTRIINLNKRRGDNAKLVVFELTERKIKEPKKKKKAAAEETTEAIEKTGRENKPKETQVYPQERKDEPKKPAKKFLGGIRNIFKKERDSL